MDRGKPSHKHCTDKAPCGPKCPRWEFVLTEKQAEQMRAFIARLGEKEQ